MSLLPGIRCTPDLILSVLLGEKTNLICSPYEDEELPTLKAGTIVSLNYSSPYVEKGSLPVVIRHIERLKLGELTEGQLARLKLRSREDIDGIFSRIRDYSPTPLPTNDNEVLFLGISLLSKGDFS